LRNAITKTRYCPEPGKACTSRKTELTKRELEILATSNSKTAEGRMKNKLT